MSEKHFKLESTLQRLKFQQPGPSFASSGIDVIRQNEQSRPNWNVRLGLALSLVLVVSLGFNLLQLRGNKSMPMLGGSDNQAAYNTELLASDVSDPASIFRFLCLTRTSVVLNGSLNLGELKGFGEWAFFDVPNNYQVTVSLLPLREWSAIGVFEDGNISLQLEDGNQLELRGAGMGPSGIQRGGPFPVYGHIQKFSAANRAVTAITEIPSASTERDSAGSLKNDAFPQISNVLAGVDTSLGAITRKYFGALINSGECG